MNYLWNWNFILVRGSKVWSCQNQTLTFFVCWEMLKQLLTYQDHQIYLSCQSFTKSCYDWETLVTQNLSQPTSLSQELYLFGHLTSWWLVERGPDHLLLSSFPFFKSPVLQNDKGSGLCHSWSAHEIKAFHGLKYFISPNYKILYGYEGTYFEISIWRNSWSGDSWIYWKVGKWETGQWLKRWCFR